MPLSRDGDQGLTRSDWVKLPNSMEKGGNLHDRDAHSVSPVAEKNVAAMHQFRESGPKTHPFGPDSVHHRSTRPRASMSVSPSRTHALNDVTPERLAARIEARLAQIQVETGMAPPRPTDALKNLKRGHWPTLSNLLDLAERLGVHVSELLEPTEGTSPTYPTSVNPAHLRIALDIVRRVTSRVNLPKTDNLADIESRSCAEIYRLLSLKLSQGDAVSVAIAAAEDTAESVIRALSAASSI